MASKFLGGVAGAAQALDLKGVGGNDKAVLPGNGIKHVVEQCGFVKAIRGVASGTGKMVMMRYELVG